VRFKDIMSGSKAIASGLARMGFVSGDTLSFVTYETAQLYLVQLAVWRLGGAVHGCFQQENPGISYQKYQNMHNFKNFLTCIQEKTVSEI
jgi:acyl-coenzyme A synthetase/AMP-(fatty) acid ligase